jgi:hypothetical protein
VTFKLTAPDPGKISVVEESDKVEVGKASARAKRAGKVLVTVTPGGQLAKLIAKKHHKKISLRLSVTFTPRGGNPRTKTVAGISLPATKPPSKPKKH